MSHNKLFFSNRNKKGKEINKEKPSNTESVFIILLYNYILLFSVMN